MLNKIKTKLSTNIKARFYNKILIILNIKIF